MIPLDVVITMDVRIHPSWLALLQDEFTRDSFRDLATFVRSSYLHSTIYPPPRKIFRAFDECPPESLKVIILGQDPYHTPGVADGLSFSSTADNSVPPSLRNIFQEIHNEFGTPISSSPDLTRWAQQGVLLLNATLTVERGKPASHQGKGWEEFTDAVIAKVSETRDHLVFMLWGNFAKQKESLIDAKRHCILKSPHPSPFSAHHGFFGNNHFKLCNGYLSAHQRKPIDW